MWFSTLVCYQGYLNVTQYISQFCILMCLCLHFRAEGHNDLADRLVEIQYELTDRLAFYVCGKKPGELKIIIWSYILCYRPFCNRSFEYQCLCVMGCFFADLLLKTVCINSLCFQYDCWNLITLNAMNSACWMGCNSVDVATPFSTLKYNISTWYLHIGSVVIKVIKT